MIPSERISPQAPALLQYLPAAELDRRDRLQLSGAAAHDDASDAAHDAPDAGARTNDQLIGQVAYQHTTTGQTTLFGFTDDSGVSGIDASVNWSHRFSQLMSLRLRYQFTGVTNRTTPYFANRTNVSGDAGIAGNDQAPANWGPPALQFSTHRRAQRCATPAFTRDDTHSGGAEATWTHGRHNLTFGGDARRVTHHDESQQNPRGSFTFTGARPRGRTSRISCSAFPRRVRSRSATPTGSSGTRAGTPT